MTMLKFRNYVRVESEAAFKEAIASIEGPIVLLAGGSDVLVQAREDDRFRDHTALDIFGVEAWHQIVETEKDLVIGAIATHAMIADSPLVNRYAPILAEASLSVGSPQIRNHSTIGGNIANASPAADTLASLSVLEAELVILGEKGERKVALADIFEGPYRTNLSDRDVIVSVVIPKLPESVRYNYTKVGRRKALSISRMTIATLIETDREGVVTKFDMTLGATFPKPMTFPDISAMLVGKKPSSDDIRAVARALSDKIPEIAGIRASTRYKQPVCRRLAARILHELIGDE
jgi:CO/xanthine dehydrogenase FAD-binding subunit